MHIISARTAVCLLPPSVCDLIIHVLCAQVVLPGAYFIVRLIQVQESQASIERTVGTEVRNAQRTYVLRQPVLAQPKWLALLWTEQHGSFI